MTSIVRIPIVRRFPNGAPLVVGVVLASGIAALDWAAGSTMSFSLLYVIAVMVVTWLGSWRHGTLVAALAAAQSLFASFRTTQVLGLADLWNAAMLLGVLMVVAALVALLHAALVEQRHHATTDPLTGAMNRRAFGMIAERERLRASREGTPLTLAYFDLDDFKVVNDLHGHSAGDGVLTSFAQAVEGAIRGTDLIARLGGDEFVLLLPDTDARQGIVVVDRVRRLLAGTCQIEGRPLTTSVGVATYRFPPTTVDAMISGADTLMYDAKSRGGDTVVGMVYVGPWSSWSETVDERQPTLTPVARIPISG